MFRFMVLTPEKKEKVESLIAKTSIDAKSIIIENLGRAQVPDYLSSADIAFCGTPADSFEKI